MSFDYAPYTELINNVPTKIWMGNEQVDAVGGAYFEVEDPATGKVLAKVADADSSQWMKTLDLADAAQNTWAKEFTARQRADVLVDLFNAVQERTDDFAKVMTLEMGKSYAESKGEVGYGSEYLRWFAEEAVRIDGHYGKSPSGAGTIRVTHDPVGPCLAVTPWNFPFAMATRKIAPALAAGCTMIVKPAKETPLTMLLLGEVISEVFEKHNVPSGVVSIVPTTKSSVMSRELMEDARLRKVTFTGSTGVGKILVEQSAKNLQRTSMELGGNAPFVIHKDADLDRVLDCAYAAKRRNGGQACVAANRFIVHEDVAAEFTRRITQKLAQVTVGHGLGEGVDLGPMITAAQRDGIAKLVDDARKAGATVHTGGEVPEGEGYFYPATVLSEIPEDAEILREEIFGPVVAITTYSDLDDAIAAANDTSVGLAAYGFSENVHTAERLAHELNSGMVAINRGGVSDVAAPFGGIKESGFGREGGTEGINEYLDTRYIATP